jgi:hypothetical protein
VNAAIAADDNDFAHPIADMSGDLIFEIAHRAAADYVRHDTARLEQSLNPFETQACTTAPGRWVNKK